MSLLCSLLYFSDGNKSNSWRLENEFSVVFHHWALASEGFISFSLLLPFAWKWPKGSLWMRKHATSGREGHYFLVTMKRFKQGLLSEIWFYLHSHFLAGSHFLPIDVLPPGLTSSRGAVIWKTGECWSARSKWMVRAISGLVCSPSETRKGTHAHTGINHLVVCL